MKTPRMTSLTLSACSTVVVVVAVAHAQEDGRSISVQSDTAARYSVLNLERRATIATITTQRTGPSGTSYSTREVDCAKQMFRYAAEGETLDELRKSRISDRMGPLVAGSISFYVADFACRQPPSKKGKTG